MEPPPSWPFTTSRRWKSPEGLWTSSVGRLAPSCPMQMVAVRSRDLLGSDTSLPRRPAPAVPLLTVRSRDKSGGHMCRKHFALGVFPNAFILLDPPNSLQGWNCGCPALPRRELGWSVGTAFIQAPGIPEASQPLCSPHASLHWGACCP